MKKKLAVLLAFMMILSTMCSLNLVSAEPDPDAPVYNVVAGATSTLENFNGNMALGQKLLEKADWGTEYSGKFPVTVTLENTASGASGLIFVKYDKTKVTPIAATTNIMGAWQSWHEATASDEKVCYASENTVGQKINNLDSGVDPDAGYVFMVWNGTNGSVDANAYNEAGYALELGAFVFETKAGVTVGDFDDNTFVLGSDIAEDTLFSHTKLKTPLELTANGSKKYGQSDSSVERLPMTVKFTYPKAEPVEQFTVTFVKEDGSTLKTVTKNVGEEVAVADFPPVPDKPGYTGKWEVEEAITTTMTVKPVYTKIPDEPDPDAPVYNVVAGATSTLENFNGNMALGQKLLEKADWGTEYSGKFPVTVTLENTASGASGLIFVKYDKTKVTPIAATTNIMGAWQSWHEATASDEKVCYASENTVGQKINNLDSGVDPDAGYVFMVWNGTNGSVDANAYNEAGYALELGAFVFETKAGVTVGDFDDNTFVLGSDIAEDTLFSHTKLKTPLELTANGSKKYGQSDSSVERLPMTVKFTYPKAEPVEQFTVTFVADGVTVNTITKNVGEKVAVSEFPEVPSKAGFTGAWDVKEDITTTTTVNAVYTPISTGDAKLNAIFTDGFKVADFDADTKEYKDIKASIGYDNYVIAGYADAGVKIEYSIDNGAFESANKENAFYFDLERGKMTSVKIKLTNAAGEETIYSFEIVLPAAEVSYFETSGFEIEGFTPETKEYTVTPDSSEKYMRLWGKGPVDDDGIKFEYAIGEATDTPESKDYEALAVNCDARENEYFEGTSNFDVNWSEKGFVNLWTKDGLSGKAMFIKVISEGAPDSYYVIKFQ